MNQRLFPSARRYAFHLVWLMALLVWIAPAAGQGADAGAPIHFVPPGTKVQDLPKLAPVPSATSATATPARKEDQGDFYLLADKRTVRLLRAKGEAAIRFKEGTSASIGAAVLKRTRGVAEHRLRTAAHFTQRGTFHLLQTRDARTALDMEAIRQAPGVEYAFPVLVDPKSNTRMILTDEVLAGFAPSFPANGIEAAARAAGLQVVASVGPRKMHSFRLQLIDPKKGNPLRASRILAREKGVRWAQPNFLREIRHFFTPPNPLFADQQTLQNTGQNGGIAHADVDAADAWERTTGSSSIVIAIIDDGVDISHPGLRIFANPGESGYGRESNGRDDDGNGLVDDVHGWDFANGDNDCTPVGTNGHGTGCAGIAAATLNAAGRTVGIAPGCTILPVKIADDTGNFSTDDIIGEAITYAASFADVLSNSWGGGSESPFIDAAIDDAVTNGRHGRGCPVFFATGNYASTWYQGGSRFRLSTAGLSGQYYYSFYYQKGTQSGGEDAVRVDNVCLLGADGYTHLNSVLPDENFEGVFFPPPDGWWLATSGSDTPYWTVSSQNALHGTGGSFSAVSPAMASGQYAWLITPLMTLTGSETFAFAASVSMPTDSDFYILVYDSSLNFVGYYGPANGVPDTVTTDTTYPASYPNAIAVGAATDCDLRSDYSEYGGHIDFVAPSNGGWNDVATLDPQGSVGWTPDDFKMNFGGTSAATPMAAGIAGLILSINPTLTADQVKAVMHRCCDQIGGVPYTNGTSVYYGYGRLNAARAVANLIPAVSVTGTTVAEPAAGSTASAPFTLTLSATYSQPITVTYSTSDGSATAPQNYISSTGSTVIPAGMTSQVVGVAINGGVLQQPSATFQLNLDSAVNSAIDGSSGTAVITAHDSDGDGMPDYWELANGFDPNDSTDAAQDADGDGVSNLNEFLAGTDPRNPASSPRIISISLLNRTDAMVIFTTVRGKSYLLQSTDDLSLPAWKPVAPPVMAIRGSAAVIDYGAATSATHRFYRVQVLP